MYAVIKTGGKQYRVKAGDLLVVEKLGGEPGSAVAFDQVLMLGDDAAVTVGAPTVSGAAVQATLIETRKGEKIKVFKKIRRQGYRRTGGHRQQETVLRVTSIVGEGKTDSWDGEVDLTPLSVLNARARGLKEGADFTPPVAAEAPAKSAKAKTEKAPKAEPAAQADAEIIDAGAAEVVAAPKPAAQAAEAAPKAAKKPAKAKPSMADGEDA